VRLKSSGTRPNVPQSCAIVRASGSDVQRGGNPSSSGPTPARTRCLRDVGGTTDAGRAERTRARNDSRVFRAFRARRLAARISSAHVLDYVDPARYDLVVPRVHLYVQPTRAWLAAFHRLLRTGGLFFITYYERCGASSSWPLRALHRAHQRLTGLGAEASAQRLYAAKWDAIPHTRRFESWVMDVLENPSCARRRLSMRERSLRHGGERIRPLLSYPHYGDVLAMEWHKREPALEERAARARAHIERSTLSFLAGRKLYIGDSPRAAVIAAGAREAHRRHRRADRCRRCCGEQSDHRRSRRARGRSSRLFDCRGSVAERARGSRSLRRVFARVSARGRRRRRGSGASHADRRRVHRKLGLAGAPCGGRRLRPPKG